MSGDRRGVLFKEEFPDLPLVGHTFIHMKHLPEKFGRRPELLDDLRQELSEIANDSSLEFHDELITEAHVTEGSLFVDIFFNCELQTLLSKDNLELLRVYEDIVIDGARRGTQLYVAHQTFKAIKRLHRKMYKLCIALKNYIYLRASLAKHITNRRVQEVKGEARGGLLGILSRLYDASNVCQGTAQIKYKLNSITSIRNSLKTMDDILIREEDRKFMCKLLAPVVDDIPNPSDRDFAEGGEEAKKYLSVKEEVRALLSRIC